MLSIESSGARNFTVWEHGAMAEFVVAALLLGLLLAGIYSLTLTQEECEEELQAYVVERLRSDHGEKS